MKHLAVYWSRRDFRIHDNPALSAALSYANENDGCMIPAFIIEDYMLGKDPGSVFGYPQQEFLSQALPAFASQFPDFLVLRGKGAHTIRKVVRAISGKGYQVAVFVNDDIHPDFSKQISKLEKAGIDIRVLPDQLTVSKEWKTTTGGTYSVFTPFKKAVWEEFMTAPVLGKARIGSASYLPRSAMNDLDRLHPASPSAIRKLFPKRRTFHAQGSSRHTFDLDVLTKNLPDLSEWYTTEQEALKRFKHFVAHNLLTYQDTRDSLEQDATGHGTSRMSLGLAWGLVSARMLRSEIQTYTGEEFHHFARIDGSTKWAGVASYLSELIWREFYKYLLYHHPSLLDQEFQQRFRGTITWVEDSEASKRFVSWIKGETGYDIVDAAMTQLARTGWMHNRARMIVASVLTKNLGVDWRWGQEYFRAQLIDLDEASNNGGWQWGASVGADPKPIRIFNPYLQAQNYDASGAYRKLWLGEDRYFFEDKKPIVEHADARKEALARYGLGGSRPIRDF